MATKTLAQAAKVTYELYLECVEACTESECVEECRVEFGFSS